MTRQQKVYVITENGEINPNVFTNLRGVSKEINVSERTLWRWVCKQGYYAKGLYVVKPCVIVRIKGRGRF